MGTVFHLILFNDRKNKTSSTSCYAVSALSLINDRLDPKASSLCA